VPDEHSVKRTDGMLNSGTAREIVLVRGFIIAMRLICVIGMWEEVDVTSFSAIPVLTRK
jgi:hypothetical protein